MLVVHLDFFFYCSGFDTWFLWCRELMSIKGTLPAKFCIRNITYIVLLNSHTFVRYVISSCFIDGKTKTQVSCLTGFLRFISPGSGQAGVRTQISSSQTYARPGTRLLSTTPGCFTKSSRSFLSSAHFSLPDPTLITVADSGPPSCLV